MKYNEPTSNTEDPWQEVRKEVAKMLEAAQQQTKNEWKAVKNEIARMQLEYLQECPNVKSATA